MKLLIIIISFALTGCISETEYNRDVEENKKLLKEVDELKNGEKRIVALIEKALEEKDYKKSKELNSKLDSKHPA